MKPFFGLAVMLLLIHLIGCGFSKSTKPKELSPDEVIRRHFLLLNQKNQEGAELCMIPERRNEILWDLDLQYHRKLISVVQDNKEDVLYSYLKTGRGSKIKPYAIKIYKVKFDLKYDMESISSNENGINTWYYYVVKQTKDSPWLIDDWGI